MATLITAREIDAAAGQGKASVVFDRGSIITPAARDRARELGITILQGGAESPSPAPGRNFVASAPPPPAAPAPPPVSVRSEDVGHPTYFENPVIDNLINITLELGAALWVVKDRLRVVEDIMQSKGIVLNEEIEQYRTPPERERDLRARRDAFIERIYKSIKDNPG